MERFAGDLDMVLDDSESSPELIDHLTRGSNGDVVAGRRCTGHFMKVTRILHQPGPSRLLRHRYAIS